MKKLSIVIPCYNEKATISRTLPLILAALRHISSELELIIIDDGSQDKTQEEAEKFLKDSKLQYFIKKHEKNKGKGAAVRTGVELATGDYILFFDIDLSTNLAALQTLMPLIQLGNHPIIIGSRLLPESKIIKTQNIFRVLAGNLYRKLGIQLLGLKVSDIGCGFKCFRADIAKELFSKMIIERWSFDAEILFLAHKKNIPIMEIPVIWKNDPKSKLSLLKDGLISLLDIIKIRRQR